MGVLVAGLWEALDHGKNKNAAVRKIRPLRGRPVVDVLFLEQSVHGLPELEFVRELEGSLWLIDSYIYLLAKHLRSGYDIAALGAYRDGSSILRRHVHQKALLRRDFLDMGDEIARQGVESIGYKPANVRMPLNEKQVFNTDGGLHGVSTLSVGSDASAQCVHAFVNSAHRDLTQLFRYVTNAQQLDLPRRHFGDVARDGCDDALVEATRLPSKLVLRL